MPNVIVEWICFQCRDQVVGESIADYVADLKRLTTRKFQGTEHYKKSPCMTTWFVGLLNESTK